MGINTQFNSVSLKSLQKLQYKIKKIQHRMINCSQFASTYAVFIGMHADHIAVLDPPLLLHVIQ